MITSIKVCSSIALSSVSKIFENTNEIKSFLLKDLEKQYGEDFGKWLAIQEDLRNTLKEKVKDTKKREKFWHKLVDENGENLLDVIRAGELEQAEQLVERCMK